MNIRLSACSISLGAWAGRRGTLGSSLSRYHELLRAVTEHYTLQGVNSILVNTDGWMAWKTKGGRENGRKRGTEKRKEWRRETRKIRKGGRKWEKKGKKTGNGRKEEGEAGTDHHITEVATCSKYVAYSRTETSHKTQFVGVQAGAWFSEGNLE